MAGVSTKEIKNRIRSMESTKQITKAMEMVAASKLRKAQTQVLSSRPYFEILYGTIQDILSNNREKGSAYLKKRPVKKSLFVVIAGDRGLAGGYNSNILKLVAAQTEGKDAMVLPIGKKAMDYFRSHQVPILNESYGVAENISVGDCFTVAKLLCKAYLSGEVDEIHLVYTRFNSVLSQTATAMQLLPLPEPERTSENRNLMLYEPDSETVLNTIIPEYLGGIFYGALCESRASEQAARRTAMDSATQNAEEMIQGLSLQFNRARQAAITQEITEIVAGS
ncbi:MAG: ATP synthase F1 subunit gamma [Oscillospiraceae bacterium]|nr:ATP synthase F1 subunit gamma [Oscillospiraceae bacterium]